MQFNVLLILNLSMLLLSSSAFAQEADFDIDRAIIGEERHFDPFYVTESSSLKTLIETGEVGKNEELLVLEKNGRHLAILTRHMAYHHVAQGQLENEPWLLTF